jgi:tRNA A37 methylthiotransferase MiaB
VHNDIFLTKETRCYSKQNNFKGDESLIGQIVNVKITDARANSLMGVLAI